MKYQSLFSRKNKKNVMTFLSAEFAQRVVKVTLISSLPTSGDFCHLLITFANSLDPDQAGKNDWPDLDPNYLTL